LAVLLKPPILFLSTSELDLQFQIPLDSQYVRIAAKGVVRRTEPEGMAIEFIEMQPIFFAYLEKFVETYY
jgi:hypothetical protein